MEKARMDLIVKIAERAREEELLDYDKFSLIMDLELADQEFDLRLEELLEADEYNFSHDIVGIQRHIDRENKVFTDCFVPRYAGAGN